MQTHIYLYPIIHFVFLAKGISDNRKGIITMLPFFSILMNKLTIFSGEHGRSDSTLEGKLSPRGQCDLIQIYFVKNAFKI